MGYIYVAAWDTRETPMSVVATGIASGTVRLSVGPMSHSPAASSGWEGDGAMSFGVELQARLNALVPGFTVSFNTSTLAYTIAHGTFPFAFTFNGDEGANLARALGFSGDRASALSHTSDVRPYYLIESYLDAWSKVSDVYEPDEDVVQEAVSDGGEVALVARDTIELWSDWTQAMEPEASVFTRHAPASTPWTWQEFFKHCRGGHRFKVYEDFAAGDSLGVYTLRAEGATFGQRTRARVAADWRERWDITLLTRWIQAA